MAGLGSRYWTEVIEVLRTIIPVYDKVNRVISLGKDEEYRLLGIHNRVTPGDMILDAGSGYGNMSRIALAETDGNARIIMYDPIPEMLANVKWHMPKMQVTLSAGIFEYLPFRDNTFDVVTCGYSLRDAIYLKQAIAEMHRVLKVNGRLIIVDLGKPDSVFARAMVSAYLKYFLGLTAYLVAGKTGLRFRTLYGTYLRWPQNSNLKTILEEKFSTVQFNKAMLGGAVIIAAYK